MIRRGLSIKSAIETGQLHIRAKLGLDKYVTNLASSYQLLLDLNGEIAARIASAPEQYLPPNWQIFHAGLFVLGCQGRCLAIALGAEGDLAGEQTRLNVLFSDLKRQIRDYDYTLPESLESLRQSIIASTDCDSTQLSKFLQGLSLPTLYLEKEDEPDFGPREESAEKQEPPPIVRLIAQLDGAPVATPQLITHDRLYSINFQVRGIGWPSAATSLQLSLLSTCPQDEYSVSSFTLPRPKLEQNSEYIGELTGNIKFKSAQSSLFSDIVFRLRGAFTVGDDEYQDVPIIGYHEVRLRVVRQENYPRMGANQRLDRHIEELLIKLVNETPQAASEVEELQPLLQALNHLVATYAQEAIYKGVSTIPEKEFQDTIVRDLKLILGSDVQNHPHQSGGIGDIRFRGVIVELKVEKVISDREALAKKYAPQAAQYQGVEARQVSILLVLDLTPKDSPPGDLRNDILLAAVPTHGGDDAKKYPSKAFVVVINGNVRSPSSYSR